MTQTVNIHEAKTHLSRLLREVERGVEIIISRNGAPVARLVPLRPAAVDRTPGILAGQIRMADDFDELPDDLLAAFQGDDGQ